MTRTEQHEIRKAVQYAAIAPAVAAASLATLIRSTRSEATRQAAFKAINDENLSDHLVSVNGCLVPRN